VASFKDGSFAQRFAAMGDEAEAKFEEITEEGHVRFGLNRPPLKMSMLPARLRHMPDYLLSGTFVEVQGVGRDQIVKLKVTKLNCLLWWSDLHAVDLFIWDSKNTRTTRVPLSRVVAWTEGPDAAIEHFHEGTPYWAIPCSALFDDA
jgi:hypothetical protein